MTQEVFEKADFFMRKIESCEKVKEAFSSFTNPNVADEYDDLVMNIGEAVIPFKDKILDLIDTLKENLQASFDKL